MNKTALSGNDDKRIVGEDKIHTMAYGHHGSKLELNRRRNEVNKARVRALQSGALKLNRRRNEVKDWAF